MELNWYEHPIYILRKHVKGTEKMLTSETYPLLPYEHQDLMDELEEMVNNNNKTIADLFTFASGSELTEVMEKTEMSYLEMDKESFYNELLSKVQPKRLSMTMNFIKKDKSIVAYSAFGSGFYNETFKIDDDFKVTFATNFGYGSMSYFKATLCYKDIPILLGPRYPNAQILSYYAQSDGIYLTCAEPRYNVTLDLKPDIIEYKKAMDAIAILYNKLVANMSISAQAIVLNKDLSKTISANYWSTDFLK